MKNSETAFSIRSKVPVKLAGNKEALFTTFNNIDDEHIAIVFGDALEQNAPLVRVHSECLTGDVFDSRFCIVIHSRTAEKPIRTYMCRGSSLL